MLSREMNLCFWKGTRSSDPSKCHGFWPVFLYKVLCDMAAGLFLLPMGFDDWAKILVVHRYFTIPPSQPLLPPFMR